MRWLVSIFLLFFFTFGVVCVKHSILIFWSGLRALLRFLTGCYVCLNREDVDLKGQQVLSCIHCHSFDKPGQTCCRNSLQFSLTFLYLILTSDSDLLKQLDNLQSQFWWTTYFSASKMLVCFPFSIFAYFVGKLFYPLLVISVDD